MNRGALIVYVDDEGRTYTHAEYRRERDRAFLRMRAIVEIFDEARRKHRN